MSNKSFLEIRKISEVSRVLEMGEQKHERTTGVEEKPYEKFNYKLK